MHAEGSQHLVKLGLERVLELSDDGPSAAQEPKSLTVLGPPKVSRLELVDAAKESCLE